MFLLKREILVIVSLFLFQLTGKSQVTDSIIHLPEIIIQDSTLRKVFPIILISNSSFEFDASNDLGEILKNQSNVSGLRRGGYAVDPVVRGYRYSQVNVFLDEGIHIEGGCPNRMDPVISHVEPELVKYIQVVKGPYLMKYGPSSSSAIRIKTRPDEDSFNKGFGVTSISGYDDIRTGYRQHLELRSSKQKTLLNISGGFKKSSNYKDGNGIEWKSAFLKKYVSTDLGYIINKSQYVVLSYKGAFADDILFPALPMDEDTDMTHIISAYYEKNNNAKKQNLVISAYCTDVYHLMDNSLRPQASQIVPPYNGIMQASALVNTKSLGGRIAFSYPFKKLKIQQGIDTRSTIKDGTRKILMIMNMDGQEFTSSKSFNLWRNAEVFNSGLFTEIGFNKGNLEILGVVRLDYNYSNSQDTLTILKNNKNWFKVYPSNSLLVGFSFQSSYKLNSKSLIGISLARSQRAADLQEKYIKFLATGYDNYDYLGNPELKPETNLQLDLMYSYKSENLQCSLNLFASKINNFISGTYLPPSIARPLTMGAQGVKQFQNLEKALFRGFEVGISFYPTDRTSITIGSGYTYAYLPEFEKILLTNNQPSGTEILKHDPIAEMPAWDTELKGSINFKNINLKIELAITAISDQNVVSKSFNESKTPGYMLTDLAVIYSPVNLISIVAGFNNIFNVAYYDHLNRKILGSTMKLYEPGRSFFMMLKLKVN